MYFWKTNDLAKDLKDELITERDKKNYYLGTGIMGLISLLILRLSPTAPILPVVSEYSIAIIVLLVGINIVFKTNGSTNGKDFLGKIICLSFPLTIKITIISLIYGILIGLISELTSLKSIVTWSNCAFNPLIQIWYFWKLNSYLRIINGKESEK